MILRAALGFLLSPMVAAVTYALGARVLLRSAPGPGTSFGEWIIVGLLLAGPFTYVVGIVLGLPAFLLLRRSGWLKLWLVSLAGGFAVYFQAYFCSALDRSLLCHFVGSVVYSPRRYFGTSHAGNLSRYSGCGKAFHWIGDSA